MTYQNLDNNNDGAVDAPVDNDSVKTEKAAITTPSFHDVFVVGGQSNAVGQGSGTSPPSVNTKTAKVWDPDTDTLVDINDASETDNSAWPAFAEKWRFLTGRPVLIVPAAENSSAQHADADNGSGNWDTTGTLRDRLVTRLNSAVSRLEAEGYTAHVHGILWSQGEQDADEISASTITATQYYNALTEMVDYFETELEPEYGSIPLFIFETGYPEGGDTSGYQAVRRQQRKAARNTANIGMASSKQKLFPDEGLANTVHYVQEGYDIMGRTGAENIAEGVLEVPHEPIRVGVFGTISGDGSNNPVSFSSPDRDLKNEVSTANDNVELEDSGVYRLSATLYFGSTGAGVEGEIRFTKNGSMVSNYKTNLSENSIHNSYVVEVDSGDTVSLFATQDSGADISLAGSAGDAQLSWFQVEPVDATVVQQ